MTAMEEALQAWLEDQENEHLEFKEAKNNFHFDKLVKYCAALANEGGGILVLGVTDARPRQVVGSSVFPDLERTKAGLLQRLRLRIDVAELHQPGGRVLVFNAPPRPMGMPVAVDGAYWMRAGQDLAPMTPDMLRRIFDETGPDFSAEICAGATLADLAPEAIAAFRTRWHRRTHNGSLLRCSDEQLLEDAELAGPAGITYAALILLGSPAGLSRHLPQAELVFEYRSSDAAGPAAQREEFRQGFLLHYDRLWGLINLRNDRQHYQDGLFMMDLPTFSEEAVREAVLNAVAHRDYRNAGSVFIRQYPRRLEVVSPGGFPEGVTAENILDRQQPRNRRIAEALQRCGLVERAGQGANRMFEACIRQGKALPDFANTDPWQVSLTLHGQVQDPRFVQFLEKVAQETQWAFDTRDLLILDAVHREIPVVGEHRPRLRRLMDAGVVETIGRGRGIRYLLSRRFYSALGQRGVHTRRRGLDREENKALLLRHLRECGHVGCQMSELQQVLPSRSRDEIKRLLNELRQEGLVRLAGERRGARWYAEPVD